MPIEALNPMYEGTIVPTVLNERSLGDEYVPEIIVYFEGAKS